MSALTFQGGKVLLTFAKPDHNNGLMLDLFCRGILPGFTDFGAMH
jgi:hypothetical protein